jgi:hypothetical protein
VWVSQGGRNPVYVKRYQHDVVFNGHSGSVLLKQETPIGGEIHVLYVPESPELYVPGEAGEQVHVLWGRLRAGGFLEHVAFKTLVVGVIVLLLKGIGIVCRLGRKLWSGQA